jgi:hypothetical protein
MADGRPELATVASGPEHGIARSQVVHDRPLPREVVLDGKGLGEQDRLTWAGALMQTPILVWPADPRLEPRPERGDQLKGEQAPDDPEGSAAKEFIWHGRQVTIGRRLANLGTTRANAISAASRLGLASVGWRQVSHQYVPVQGSAIR